MTARKAAGFTLFEFAVVAVIFGVLVVVLSERLLAYQEYAEKTVMEATVRNLRTGLRNQIANLMNQDRMREADRLLHDNPINWLEKMPPNYAGELADPAQNMLKPGFWYFDVKRHELVYVPQHRRFFVPAIRGDYSVRFRITALQPPQVGSSSAPSVEKLALTQINAYKWNWQE